MTIFTIDNENSITAFATAEAANAASATPFDLFTNQQELAELIANWPAERLLATYNSLPGVKPVKALKDSKTAAKDLGARREARADGSAGAGGGQTRSCSRQAEGREKGHWWRTGREGRAR